MTPRHGARPYPRVFGIPAPKGEELTPAYRVWFAAYRAVRVTRHRLGLHAAERVRAVARSRSDLVFRVAQFVSAGTLNLGGAV